jgi:hypothetical protein
VLEVQEGLGDLQGVVLKEGDVRVDEHVLLAPLEPTLLVPAPESKDNKLNFVIYFWSSCFKYLHVYRCLFKMIFVSV